MANLAPANPFLLWIVQSDEQRRLRRNEYSRALTAAMQTGRRSSGRSEVQREEIELMAAEHAYSADVVRVVVQNRVYVHNMQDLEALMQVLEDATPPYALQRVTIHNPDPDVAEELRVYLENAGFELQEENDTYTIPPQLA